MTFELSKDGWNLPEPTIEIRRDISQPLFQALINEFVRHGMHADNDKVAGQLESQTKHLEDMRRLVFNRIPDGNL